MNEVVKEEKQALGQDARALQKDPAAVARHVLLSASAGASGAFGVVLCSHVFANAETGNLISLAIELKSGSWIGVLARLGAVALFMLGIWVSVRAPQRLFGGDMARWRQCCLWVQAALFAVQGLLPAAPLLKISAALYLWPVFFASALQYNTFNLLEGVPISTVFSTNNLRQLTLHALLWRDSGSMAEARIARNYALAVLGFTLGALGGLYLIDLFAYRAIFASAAAMLLCRALLPRQAA